MSRPRDHRGLWQAAFCVLALGGVAGAAADSGSQVDAADSAMLAAAATYRVQVRADELAAWKRFRAGAPFLRGQAAIDGMVLVRSLAAEAESDGMAERPDVRVDLLRVRGSAALAWLRREVADGVVVAESAVEAALLASPPRPRPRRKRLRNLFLRWPADIEDRDAVRADMAALRRALDQGADFADLARQRSQSETRWRGGLLGNVRPGTFRPEVERVIADLDAGETSAPIASEDGLTLIHCERVLPAVPVNEPAWRTRIANRIWRATFEAQWQGQIAALDALAEFAPKPVGGTSADGAVLRYRGGSLTAAELAAVVGVRDADALAAVAPARRDAAVQAFVRGQMARQVRRESGWRPDADARAQARWQRRQILANHQLAARVAARFTEPTDAQLREHFRDHADRFARPQRLRLSLIQLPRTADDPRGDMARASRSCVRFAPTRRPSATPRGSTRGIPRRRAAGSSRRSTGRR